LKIDFAQPPVRGGVALVDRNGSVEIPERFVVVAFVEGLHAGVVLSDLSGWRRRRIGS